MENEKKVIEDLIAELHKVTEENRTEMKGLRTTFLDRIRITDAEKEAIHEHIRQTECETNKVSKYANYTMPILLFKYMYRQTLFSKRQVRKC